MSDLPDIPDQPDARFAAFAELTGEAPQTYSGRLTEALRHTSDATEDGSAERWKPIGPRNVGGSIRALVQDPRAPDTLYAGAPFGGLFKTENAGHTWRSIGGTRMELPIGSLALAPSDSRTLWVGTGLVASAGALAGQGLFLSRDAGETFQKIAAVAPTSAPPPGTAERFSRVVVDPLEPTRAWAATETGLWRYDPGGTPTAEGLDATGANLLTGAPVTDVALARNPNGGNQYILLAGVSGIGVFRGVYDRTRNSTVWSAVGAARWGAGAFARVKVAFSARRTGGDPRPFAYAILEDQGIAGAGAGNQGWPTGLYQSTDFGVTWGAPGPQPFAPAGGGFAWWPLCLDVDPRNPRRVVVGYVDIQVTGDGGGSWAANAVLDWRNGSRGDRGQHSDQHTVLFDVRDAHPNRIWVSNDGGVSMTEDLTVPRGDGGPMTNQAVWRKRSYGITAAQLVDLTTHPVFPSIFGGGMQDNGTSVSFGGPTWYRIWGGDGGQLAFDPANPRRFFPTSQNSPVEVNYNAATTLNRVPLPDLDPPGNQFEPQATSPLSGLGGAGLFIGVIEGHSSQSGRLLIGRTTGGFYTNTAVDVGPLTLPGSGGGMSAAAFAPGSNQLWVGTTDTRVYRRDNTPLAPGPAHGAIGGWIHRPLPASANGRISSIAVHPTNVNVVAVATMPAGDQGRVYLTHDRGANWRELLGTGDRLPNGPVTSLAWDPASTRILYAGTLGGVYVVRNLPAQPAGSAAVPAVDPEWHVYSRALPIVLVNDVHVVPVTGTLRCATHARGAFECNLSSTPAPFRIPAVRLSLRVHVADDTYAYAPPNVDFDDPRRPAPAPAATDYDYTRAFDIRIDAPSFQRSESFRFGDPIDGAEFDEQLVSDRALVGDINYVYVQALNRGNDAASNVSVHLYFADAGSPANPPALDPAALSFPGDPTGPSAWKRAAPPQVLGGLRPGEPAVLRFEWTPPLSITDNVALLGIVTNADDPVGAVPAGPVQDFVKASRHCGLRVSAVDRDTVFIRDGLDDRGGRGEVAWGGRSPDIIVRRVADLAAGFDPAVAFADVDDPHLEQRVRAGDHRVFVRVHNRTLLPARVQVQLWRIPMGAPAPGSGWTQIGGDQQIGSLPGRSHGFVAFDWTGVTDPGGGPGRGFGLMALARVVDPGTGRILDPYPDQALITDLESFWEFFSRAPVANNAALLALRFEAAP